MPTNRTRSTPKKADAWKRKFLDSLGKGATVTDAAQGAGIKRSTAYDARISDVDFAEAWDANQLRLMETIEQTIYTQALRGDTALLIFVAKAKLRWSDRPQPDDELREQVAAMQMAIAELDPETQELLLALYSKQLGARATLAA